MTKVKFVKTKVVVEKEEKEMWVLETPAFLENKKDAKERVKIYYDAINEKITDENFIKDSHLRDYQQKTVEYAKNFNSFAIFDEPRLGKTPTTIEIIKAKNLLNSKILIISPSNVISNWIKEFKKWGNKKAIKYNGEDLTEITENILVITYQRAVLSNDKLLKWNADVVVLDEAHILRNSRGRLQRHKMTQKQKEEYEIIEKIKQKKKVGFLITEKEQKILKEYQKPISRNKAILNLGNKAKHKYALTGTPSVNDGEDIFAILQFILPKFFKSYWSFVYYYFDVRISYFGGREIKKILNKQKEKELQQLLDYISTRNVQKEQMKWLKQPKITYKILKMNKRQKELEKELLEEGRLGDKYILNTLEQMVNYNSICLSPRIIKDLNETDFGTKIEYILDYIMNNYDQNIAIFSTRNKFLNVLEKEIERIYKEKKIYKIKKPEESQKIQDEINQRTNEKNIIFLGTIGKSKEGISLVGINKGIIADQSWTPTDIEQLTHRLDATTPEQQDFFGEKEFEILIFENSIDTLVLEALQEKLSRTEIINKYHEFVERRKK